MKKITATISMLFISTLVFSQVEVGKAKNTIMGKSKLVASPVSELLLDHFHIDFNLYKFEEDQGGSSNVALSAKVGVRASLGEVDQALAQEISNEAYSYFVEQWGKRNVKVTMADKATMEGGKAFAKAQKKGKLAQILNGGVWENKQKKTHTMRAWPEGVDIAQSGEGLGYVYGNAKHMWQYGIGNSTGFSANVDFISFKTNKLGSTASVRSLPQLTLTGGLISTIWAKNKVGGYIGSISADGIEDYYTEAVDEELEALNSKLVMRTYKADKAKFKANVMEMIKASMDASFANYDEVVAKNM